MGRGHDTLLRTECRDDRKGVGEDGYLLEAECSIKCEGG